MSRPHQALLVIDDEGDRAALTARLEREGWQVRHGDAAGAPPSEPLRLLVVDTARPPAGRFVGGDVEQWYAAVHAAASRPFRAVRSAVPALRAAGEARVVVLGSGWEAPEPGNDDGGTAAATVQGGVVALVKTLARDLGPDGITVNEVVRTPGGPALADQVAHAVAYLAGDAAGATTGQLVGVGRTTELRP